MATTKQKAIHFLGAMLVACGLTACGGAQEQAVNKVVDDVLTSEHPKEKEKQFLIVTNEKNDQVGVVRIDSITASASELCATFYSWNGQNGTPDYHDSRCISTNVLKKLNVD